MLEGRHILEAELGHCLVNIGLLRLDLDISLEDLTCLVGLRYLGEEDVGEHLAGLDVGHGVEDACEGRQSHDAGNHHILTDGELTGSDLGVRGEGGVVHLGLLFQLRELAALAELIVACRERL